MKQEQPIDEPIIGHMQAHIYNMLIINVCET